MRSAIPAWPACLVLVAALAAPALAASNQQQASFSVAITLHTAVKPLSAAELCRDARTIQTLAATIQVDCPTAATSQQARPESTPEPHSTGEPQARPEVTVTF